MKKQYLDREYTEEINYLSDELDPREMFILGFLKGFDRRTMKDWSNKGLWDTSIDNFY